VCFMGKLCALPCTSSRFLLQPAPRGTGAGPWRHPRHEFCGQRD
jgi:hypothetical protein